MASSTIPPPRSARADPLVGSVINGKYRVVSLVASGGMGKIYRGEQLVLGRDVALKVLHAHSAALKDDPSFKKRFFLEASILSRLQHPNIVTLFDYGAIEGSDDRYFMAMEYLAGETLMRRIYERVSLTPKETVRIGMQIARGLGEAHAHGLVHRDLKPSNVMLVSGRDGRELVKVLDFGIVKVLGQNEEGEDDDRDDDLTKEGSFIGSPRYMAPEQITRGTRVDARTDVYSLGIILYQCLCGAVPFEARTSIETMMAHLSEEAIPLASRPSAGEVPEWLDQLVMACIEKDPDRRPASMELVARVLEGAEPTLSSSRGASGRFPAQPPRDSSASSPALEGDDPQQTNRYPTSMRPSRPSGRMSVRPSGHPSGSHAITETGTAIGSLPPRENGDTGAHPHRVWTAPVMIAGAALLAAVALVGERVIRGSTGDAPIVQNSGKKSGGEISFSPPKPSFRLIVESTPPGADVLEGNEVLGATPLSLAIDNAQATASPRKLVLKRAGYEPYAILQGPSEDNVRVLATLIAVPPATNEPHVDGAAGGSAPTAGAAGAAGAARGANAAGSIDNPPNAKAPAQSGAPPTAPSGAPRDGASDKSPKSPKSPQPPLDIRLTR